MQTGGYSEPNTRHHEGLRVKGISATGTHENKETMERETAKLVSSVELARILLERVADQQVSLLNPLVERAVAAANLSEQCNRDLLQAVGSVGSQQRWAVQREYDHQFRQLR